MSDKDLKVLVMLSPELLVKKRLIQDLNTTKLDIVLTLVYYSIKMKINAIIVDMYLYIMLLME
jgi:hypothetical protein